MKQFAQWRCVEPYCHFPTHAVTLSLLSCTQRVLNRFASCIPSSQADNAQLRQSQWKNSHVSTTCPIQHFSRSGVTLREWRSLSTSWHSPRGQNRNTTSSRWGSHAHQPWGFPLWTQHTADNVLLPRHLQVHCRQTILSYVFMIYLVI
jgi:hypothetical protein